MQVWKKNPNTVPFWIFFLFRSICAGIMFKIEQTVNLTMAPVLFCLAIASVHDTSFTNTILIF